LRNENYEFCPPDTGSSWRRRLAGGFLGQPAQRHNAGATAGAHKIARAGPYASTLPIDFGSFCEALRASFCGRTSGFRAEPSKPSECQAATPRTIVLPQKAVAGAAATLAVLDTAGRNVCPNAVVELSGARKVTTDATGRALFTVPSEPGVLAARIPA